MSKTYTYRDIRYELKETQGFYYCLVYAEGESTALFQTKYYASVESASSAAIEFIDDYCTYRKTKEEKSRFRSGKPLGQEADSQSSSPMEERSRVRSSKPLEARRITQSLKIWQENGQTRSSVPKLDSSMHMRSKSLEQKIDSPNSRTEDTRQNQRIRALPIVLLAGIALVSISIFVASASGFLESILHRDRAIPITTETGTPVVIVIPSPLQPTIALPQLSPSQTPPPTVTATITSTPTITNSPTQPTMRPTNTPRPTNFPMPTKTFTPVPTITPTQTPSQTPSPTPTRTLLPPPSPQVTPPTPGALS